MTREALLAAMREQFPGMRASVTEPLDTLGLRVCVQGDALVSGLAPEEVVIKQYAAVALLPENRARWAGMLENLSASVEAYRRRVTETRVWPGYVDDDGVAVPDRPCGHVSWGAWVPKLLALCLLWPALAGAQPLVVAKADVAGLGAEYLLPAELDGDAGTREFLQWRIGTAGETLMRAGRIGADGAVCLGEYYDPWQDAWAVLPRPIPEAHGGFHGGVYDVGGGRLKFLAQSAVVYMELDIMTAAGPHLAAPLAFGCR